MDVEVNLNPPKYYNSYSFNVVIIIFGIIQITHQYCAQCFIRIQLSKCLILENEPTLIKAKLNQQKYEVGYVYMQKLASSFNVRTIRWHSQFER